MTLFRDFQINEVVELRLKPPSLSKWSTKMIYLDQDT